ncbi:MAG: alkaline phosphatase family protein [Gemmatimonadota bacterium]
MSRVLLVFVDGVGIGPDDPATNAFTAAPPPAISSWLRDGRASLVPLDARLDTDGLPQSGTGQYSLFTGDNGARKFGRHYGPWVPTALRDPLRKDNVLTRAVELGLRVTFANAYPEELISAAQRDGAFHALGPLRAGPPLVAAGAGVLTRHTDALRAGDAIASEITNEGWRVHLQRHDLPAITPAQAGANLGRIANAHDLTLFAHYSTDAAGHQQDLNAAIAALHTLDAFLSGALENLADDVVLLVVSDHGNLEDASTGHTRNAALGLVASKDHEVIASELHAITDVAEAVLLRLRDRR